MPWTETHVPTMIVLSTELSPNRLSYTLFRAITRMEEQILLNCRHISPIFEYRAVFDDIFSN
jgi:hypothetical protein